MARRIVWIGVALGIQVVVGGCDGGGDRRASPAPTSPVLERHAGASLARAAAELDARSAGLIAIAGVAGTGLGLDARGVPVAVLLLERANVPGIPSRVGGLDVRTEVVGPLRAFALTDRYRPVPIGVSAGNAIECLPGTIGCVLTARGKRYLLSANHVFARQNQAVIGEAITQPSLPDADPSCAGAPPPTVVGRLSDFEPVVYDGKTPNRFDAAIAELTDGGVCATLAPYYGLPSSQPADPLPGAPILKVGRTTELTRGTVKAIDVKVKITFPAGTALFVGQILTSKAFGGFGDSGALVVTDDGAFHPLGIVIGGGSTGAAIASPIGPILARFGAAVCGR
ncbi:MAG: hypothetical protein ACRENJ_01095 [Candidatus Eiseniibacteriota bacterium]